MTNINLNVINEELANLNDQRTRLKAKWQAEKEIVDKIQINKQLIEDYKIEAERAERDGDFGRVAELRYGKMKEAEAAVEANKGKIDRNFRAINR